MLRRLKANPQIPQFHPTSLGPAVTTPWCAQTERSFIVGSSSCPAQSTAASAVSVRVSGCVAPGTGAAAGGSSAVTMQSHAPLPGVVTYSAIRPRRQVPAIRAQTSACRGGMRCSRELAEGRAGCASGTLQAYEITFETETGGLTGLGAALTN